MGIPQNDPRKFIMRLIAHWQAGRVSTIELKALTSLPTPDQRTAISQAVEAADREESAADLFDAAT